MGVAFESFTVTNPNRSLIPHPKWPTGPPRLSPSTSSFPRLDSPHRLHSCGLSTVARAVSLRGLGLGLGLMPLHRQGLRHRSVFSFAGSHEELPLEIGVGKEKNDVGAEAKDSQEAWKETLALFKEQLSKMQGVSQEAYETYSKKAMIILKDTSEQLKVEAESARKELDKIAKQISEESKGYLSTAAENSPEQVKDIVETFAYTTDEFNDISKVRDFYLGIPYGALLSFGGFLLFMLTGSISAIRFGCILGGIMLALSVSSLRSWRKGEQSLLALKGQTAISSILFLRQMRLLFVGPSLVSFLAACMSGAVAFFYIYRIITDGGLTKGPKLEPGMDN